MKAMRSINFLVVAAVFLSGCALQAKDHSRDEQSSRLGTEAGTPIATAIGNLARGNQGANIESIGLELQLPDLRDKLKWFGPYSPLHFGAAYAPPRSNLGIKHVRIQWEVTTIGNTKEILNILSIELDNAFCPTSTALERALNGKVSEIWERHHHGPDTKLSFLSVRQYHGHPVTVSFRDDNTCELDISSRKDL